MEIIIKLGIVFLNLIYDIHKLFPVKNRISVVSRQSESPSVDVTLLFDEIGKEEPEIETVACYKMLPQGLLGKIAYFFHMIGPEMHVLATSKVVVLEGYSISVSVLRHQKELRVIQMWHAMGSLKKFGYLALDTAEGSRSRLAKVMHMHENYDYVCASSEYCRPYFAEAFHYPLEQVKILPLPRTDLLISKDYMGQMRQRICTTYPQLEKKKNILYVPTFRKGEDMEQAIQKFADAVDYERYNLIVKLHPLVSNQLKLSHALKCSEYSSMELFSVADYVVSDYSAVIFEAAASGKPIFLYAYDLDDYLERRGFCIDYVEEMPTRPCRTVDELIHAIENDSYEKEQLKMFAEKYVMMGTEYTKKLVSCIMILYNNEDKR